MPVRQRTNTSGNTSSWQADVKLPDGTRIRKSFDTKLEAEKYVVLIEQGSKQQVKPKVELKDKFVQAYQVLWSSRPNRVNTWRITNELIAYNPSCVWPTSKVREFVHNELAKGNTHGTINRKLACLSKLLTHVSDEDETITIPKIKYLPEDNKRIRFLTIDEEQAIFQCFGPKYLDFFTFLVDTGCRYSEATKLQTKDISDTQVTFWETKGGGHRSVPLTKRASAVIMRNGTFNRVQYDAAHHAWHAAVTKAGLNDDPALTIHVLRHTCCSRLVQAGVDLRRVMQWMGHSDIRTTLRYAHLAPSDLDIGVKALEKTLAYKWCHLE